MNREQYDRVRREFDDMSVQDRAVFLVEATVSTIARGIQQAGEVLADELDKAFRWRPEPAGEGATPGAEPPPSGSSATGSSSTGGTRRRPSSGTSTSEGHIET